MLILYIKLKKARRSLEVFLYITAVKAAKKGTWKEGFKNFGKSFGWSCGSAVSYAVDEASNWVKRKNKKLNSRVIAIIKGKESGDLSIDKRPQISNH